MPQYNDGKTSQARRRFRGQRVIAVTKRSARKPVTRREVAKIAKKVAKTIPEVKHQSLAAVATVQPSSAVPLVVDLAPITQGNTETTRLGNHVTPIYAGVRYSLAGVQGAGQAISQVRIMLVQYKPNSLSAGAPAWSQLLQTQTQPWSYRDTEYSKQYRVLYDAKHLVVNDAGNQAFTVYGEIAIPSRRLRDISFNDAATSGESKLYLMAISDYVNVDFAFPTLEYDTRVRYTDC